MLDTSEKYFSLKNTLIATSRVVFDQTTGHRSSAKCESNHHMTAAIGVQGKEASETEYISHLQLRKAFNLGATLYAMV